MNVFADGLLLAYGDGLDYFYPVLSVVIEQYENLSLPLWNPHMFSGFPLMASAQHGVFYPPYILPALFLPQHIAYNLDIAIHIALAGFFTFLFAKRMGNDILPSFMAGAAFAFFGYLLSHLEHLSVLHSAVWLPLLLCLFEGLRQNPGIKASLIASLAVAIQILAGHPQVSFYSHLAVAFFVIFHAFHRERGSRMKYVGLYGLSVVVGLLIASPQIYATYELASLGVRTGMSYETFSDDSYQPIKLLSLFLPLRYGMSLHIGLVPLALAAFALIKGWRNAHVKFLGILAIAALILSLGDSIRPLHKLMFHVPVYNLFRSPAKHLIAVCLALSALSAFGFSLINSRSYIKHLAVAVMLVELFILRNVEGVDPKQVDSYYADTLEFINDTGGRVMFSPAGDYLSMLSMRKGVNIPEGYDPLIIDDYRILLGLGGAGGPSKDWSALIGNTRILSLLNVKYLITPPHEALPYPPYAKLVNSPEYSLYENTSALPRAFSVSGLMALNTIEEIKGGLYSGLIDPAKTAVVSSADIAEIGRSSFRQGTVEIISSAPAETTIKCSFAEPGFIVLSESYYPEWRAFIDGRQTNIYKTFGALKGAVVPQGEHEIKFIYSPVRLSVLIGVSLISLFAVAYIISLKKAL